MKKFTKKQIENRSSDYVCWDCGQRFLTKEQRENKEEKIATYHEDVCGLCGEVRGVTHIRHWNYLINFDAKKEKKKSINKELDAKIKDLEFIKINVEIDKEEANRRYCSEFENNVDGVADAHLSYSQWLVSKKIEALGLLFSLM